MRVYERMTGMAVGLAMAIAATAAHAQAFVPTKPVRLIVAFPPGGTTDTISRAFGQKLTGMWKGGVIVENHGGAGGNIATDLLAKSDSSGHTLLVTNAGIAISAAIYRKLPFDPLKDVAAVTQLTGTTFILVASPALAAGSMKELISLAKAQPGKFNFGSSGVGSPTHLAAEYFKSLVSIDAVHIPYKGDAQLTTAMRSGEVQFAILPSTGAMPQIRAGKLRALAKSGAKRSASLPDVPTLGEAGLPEYDFSSWIGIFAGGGTPRNILSAIRADFVRALNMPDVANLLTAGGNDLVGSTPEEFDARYKADIALYKKIIRDARVPLQD
jgi:tripartite-type tricarboxylate transporter receptor subunit TctC